MKKSGLANQLRKRQIRLGMVSTETINSLSDDAIIDSYITGSCCGEKQVTEDELEAAVVKAKSVEGFLSLVETTKTKKETVQ